MNDNNNGFAAVNTRIAAAINVLPGMKLSVVWRQFCSAVDKETLAIERWNGALAKTFPDFKKQEVIRFFNASRKGKYVVFPDGSQARYDS